MAWVPVNRSVFTHRKTMKMADLLDIPEVYAVAHLTALWTWAMDNAPSGVIPEGTSARMIAKAAEYPGNAQGFLEAILESQYLVASEGGYEFPNWMEYGGKLVVQQEKDAARKRAGRAKEVPDVSAGCPPDVRRMSDVDKKRGDKKREEEISSPLTPHEGEGGDSFWSEEGNLDTTPVEPLPVATSSERDRMRKEQERIKAQKLDLINAFAEAINPGAPVTQAFINANISAAGSLVSVGATPDLVRLAVQNHRLSWPAKTVFDLKFIESRWSSLTAVKPATPEPAAEPKHYTYDFERENWSREKMQAFIAQKKKESAEGRAYILARMNAGDFNSAESRTGGNHGQNGGVQ